MLKRSVRDKRYKLKWEWLNLRKKANNCEDIEKAIEARIEEDKVYKKWLFYDNLIKEIDKR